MENRSYHGGIGSGSKNPPPSGKEGEYGGGYDRLDEEVEFRLPRGHRPVENLDTEGLEQASVDTRLAASNVGFRLLQKMGWKSGKGLGKNEQGILEPIKAGIRDAKLGVGKQEQDDFFTAEDNVQRKRLNVELEETEEHIKKRENVSRKSAVRLRRYRRHSFATYVISSTSWHMNLRAI
uniref:G-patch domain-containing protein n=1 Tax=Aegilops tauschii subsp. strangulata TaxID=200361 RepID=A0A453A6S6_AEGTS